MNYCQHNCCNIGGYDGSCCTIENRNWNIGKIGDHLEVLEKIRKKFPGVDISWNDVFMTYEEGSKLFPDKPSWQNPNNYPCMRINLNSHRKPCIFYNDYVGFCQIYDIRPTTCSTFKCDHLLEFEASMEFLNEKKTEEDFHPPVSGRTFNITQSDVNQGINA